jgi:hypothetical protein
MPNYASRQNDIQEKLSLQSRVKYAASVTSERRKLRAAASTKEVRQCDETTFEMRSLVIRPAHPTGQTNTTKTQFLGMPAMPYLIRLPDLKTYW